MNILYVSHNDVGSPLVRSQVLPYLRGLGRLGHVVQLVTFERGLYVYPEAEFPRAHWSGIGARRGHGLHSKALDLLRGLWTVLRVARRSKASLIHARSYVPAAIAWAAGTLLRIPYLFDMRGFLGEEYVEAGHWITSDPRYRFLVRAEQVLLRDAAAIVVLTHRAKERLRAEERYARVARRKLISVVPCAVDLHRFRPATVRAAVPTLIYSGSVGMTYRLCEMLQVFQLAREWVPDLMFQIYNRGQRQLIDAELARCGITSGVFLGEADFSEMPAIVSRAHVGIALLSQTPSKIGSSAVKVAEYLACGLPVVVNARAGDMDVLIARYGAGHVVHDYHDRELERAARAVVELLNDEVSRANARSLAERYFDVDDGVSIYADTYERIGPAAAHLVD